jgi:hypothetical protein
MLAEAELGEYLDEIRQEVCSRCVERPAGGPPCLPLGKVCGVELHLPKLVEAVHEVRSDLIDPYLDNNRKKVCEGCAFLHSDHCPCPMDRLAVLVVEAVEAFDRRLEGTFRRARRVPGRADLDEALRAYQKATGTWTGCDWDTGPEGPNLNGCTAHEVEARALTAPGPEERERWAAAAKWLRLIEHRAEQAEAEATRALAAANFGRWLDAVEHARRAWALEFASGRPLRHEPPAWRRFYEVLVDAAWEQSRPEAGGAVETG